MEAIKMPMSNGRQLGSPERSLPDRDHRVSRHIAASRYLAEGAVRLEGAQEPVHGGLAPAKPRYQFAERGGSSQTRDLEKERDGTSHRLNVVSLVHCPNHARRPVERDSIRKRRIGRLYRCANHWFARGYNGATSKVKCLRRGVLRES